MRETTAGVVSFDHIHSILLHVTGQCNLSCKHCYVASCPGISLDSEQLMRVNELVLQAQKPLSITGGEPFTLPGIEDYLSDTVASGIELRAIFTNATRLSQHRAFLERLFNQQSTIAFYVSLDGVGRSHDLFRAEGSFRAALEGARMLKGLGFRVNINTILHNAIDEHDIRGLFSLISEAGFDRWRLDTPFDAGQWNASKRCHALSPEAAAGLFNLVLQLSLQDSMPFELELDHLLKYIDGTFYFLDTYSLDDPVCACKVLPIWPDGSITWCQDLFGPEFTVGTIGDALDATYERYLPFKTMSIASAQSHISACQGCGLIEHCGTGCRANSILLAGSYFDPDPEICGILRHRLYKPISDTLLGYRK